MFLFAVVEDGLSPKFPKRVIDESLFQRIGQGDRDAFERLYQMTEKPVHAFLLSILKNPEDTLDTMQDTYLKIRASAHLYRPMGKPLAWIFTIARNLAMSRLRVNGRMVELDAEKIANCAYIQDPTDRLALAAALNILEERDRQILLLHLVSGLRHREIANGLGLPLSTVLSRYSRSLKKLKAYCEKEGLLP